LALARSNRFPAAATVKTKVFDAQPNETWVYPGHGNDTTQGAERPHLEEWRERGW
jgi:glyoxylase-like metal-dependent hydrolase (beta-lactamase superfamily II)